MAHAAPTVSSTKKTTNYARLCRLLVDAGTQALRDTFNAIHPPANLQSVLAANKAIIQSLRKRKVINATQWGKLYPVIPSSVSSRDFDITLLMVLLRNLCGLPSPAAGWDTLPAATDVSLEADIARVKYYRNSVYGHAECASVDDATFNTCWGDIRDTLVRLGGAKYKAAIDDLETECMDPEVEDHYKELLSQWKKDEGNVKDKLDEVIEKLVELKTSSMTQKEKPEIEEGKPLVSKDLESSAKCKKRHNETEPLDYYCTDCKVCICDKSGKTRHTHHTKVSIQQATEEEKLKMVELVEQVKIQITEFESKVERMTRLFAISKEKISAARSLAQTTAEELIRALKEHEKCVVNELDVIEKRQERDYATQLESMQASVNELKCSVENCEDILQRDASFETLRTQINDTKKCKRVLKETKLDIYEPCHVHYHLFEEHIRVMKGRSPGELLDSNTDPSRSYVRDNDLKQPEAGRTKDFDIVTIDSEGEQCYHEIDEIKVTVRSPTGIVLDSKTDSWVPRGTYRVRYTPACDGEHEVTVLVNNEPLSGSPWSISVTPHKYSFFHYFGSPGKARKQFKEPCAVAVDKNKMTIAVADRKEQRVQLYDFCNSEHLTDLGEKGSAAIRLTNPTSVAFTQSGDVIVIASGIMFCFAVSGNFLGCINNKKLKRPFSLSVTSNGRLLVCDSGDKSVKVLSPDGTELLQSFSAPDCDGSPWKAVCHQDMFFVSYPEARCVKTFNKDGDFLYDIGKEDAREGHLSQPRGLAVDTFNNLVVCDEKKKTLNVFKLNGTFLNTATENNVLSCPSSIAALSANESPWLIIADSRKKCVIMFD